MTNHVEVLAKDEQPKSMPICQCEVTYQEPGACFSLREGVKVTSILIYKIN